MWQVFDCEGISAHFEAKGFSFRMVCVVVSTACVEHRWLILISQASGVIAYKMVGTRCTHASALRVSFNLHASADEASSADLFPSYSAASRSLSDSRSLVVPGKGLSTRPSKLQKLMRSLFNRPMHHDWGILGVTVSLAASVIF